MAASNRARSLPLGSHCWLGSNQVGTPNLPLACSCFVGCSHSEENGVTVFSFSLPPRVKWKVHSSNSLPLAVPHSVSLQASWGGHSLTSNFYLSHILPLSWNTRGKLLIRKREKFFSQFRCFQGVVHLALYQLWWGPSWLHRIVADGHGGIMCESKRLHWAYREPGRCSSHRLFWKHILNSPEDVSLDCTP